MAAIDVLSGSGSDEQLARLVRDGDERAFDRLCLRYIDALRRYTGRILRDDNAGEDAVQVALLNAYRSLRAGRMPRAVQPWLFRIARNAAFAQCAQRKELLGLPESVAAHRGVEESGVGAELVASVARLPERQRHVFILRELRGLSVRETSEALELGESQVEQLLFTAKARLAELLVFGGPVSCELVHAIAGSSLDRQQRRALKRHVHHCDDCRVSLGDRIRLGSRIGGLLEGLRRLADLLLGQAAVAKVAAVSSLAVVGAMPAVLPHEHALPRENHAVAAPVRLVEGPAPLALAPTVVPPQVRVVRVARRSTPARATVVSAPQPRVEVSTAPTLAATPPTRTTTTPIRTARTAAPPVGAARTAPVPGPPLRRPVPAVRKPEPARTPPPTVAREPEPARTPPSTAQREPEPQPAPAPEPLPASDVTLPQGRGARTAPSG